MATEEDSKLPPYPEMILDALEALKKEGGCNKSAISEYIESSYGELPADHLKLLSDHLKEMKESGELVFLKNNYMKTDPNAPPKRGRGRPRKDPNAPPTKKAKASSGGGTGRGRGRPPKKSNGGGDVIAAAAAAVSGVGELSKRPRGRPPKGKPQQAQVGVQEA